MKKLNKGENTVIPLNEDKMIILSSSYKNKSDKHIQLDLMAFVLDENNKPVNNALDFFYYGTGFYHKINYGNSYSNYNNSLTMLPFNEDGVVQKIKIDLNKISEETKKIIFIQTIFPSETNKVSFNDIEEVCLKIKDSKEKEELISFKTNEFTNNVSCFQIGEIYRHNGEFKFRALGQGYSKGIIAALEAYSFNII